MMPRSRGVDSLAERFDKRLRDRHRRRRNGRQWPIATSVSSELRRGGDVLGARLRTEWIAERDVEVDRAWTRISCGRPERPASDRAVVQKPRVVGFVGADLAEPADGRAVELDLIDRLAGTDTAQLRRPIGGQQDQRHRRLVGFAHGRMEVRRRGPRGADDGDRRPRCLGRAEGKEPAGALVDDHVGLDRGLAPEGERQRGRARAGTDDRMSNPAARKLLGHRGGERRVAVRAVHAPAKR